MKPKVSIVVPTYGREGVLLETLRHLRALEPAPDEILVVDQTPDHEDGTRSQLQALRRAGAIRWMCLAKPSIPRAMNVGLVHANSERVLFLDDDIVPCAALVGAHAEAGAHGPSIVVAGQVLQPGEAPEPLEGNGFAFRSSLAQPIGQVMGGNFSVDRELALAIGGFDESFLGAAYCFEADFSRRALAAGATIQFEPEASIRHLRTERGGTREHGSHLRTIRPLHAVGEFYYLLRHRPIGWFSAISRRPLRSIATRFHARHPWWIPVTLVAEISGLLLALRLALGRPRLLSPAYRTSDTSAIAGVSEEAARP